MIIRSRHMAEEDFDAFADEFHRGVVEGHRDFARECAAQASKYRTNTKRSIIRDNIVKQLRADLDGRRGIYIRDRYGTTYFNFFGRWRLTIRMMDEKRLGVVLNRTQLAFGFQHNVDNFPPLGSIFQGTTAVYLGYLVPENGDDLDVIMVAPNGERNAWEMPIVPKRRGDVVPLPTRGPPPAPDDEQLVHVPERGTDQEKDE